MAKKFLVPATPGARYGPDPVFRPQYSSKSIFGPAEHIVAGTKFFYITIGVSLGVLGGGNKNFSKILKIGDFGPKFGDFRAIFEKS